MLSTAAAFDAELVAAAANPALRTVIESMGAVGHGRCRRGIAIMGDAAMHVGKRQLQADRDILAAIVQQDAHAVERLVARPGAHLARPSLRARRVAQRDQPRGCWFECQLSVASAEVGRFSCHWSPAGTSQ